MIQCLIHKYENTYNLFSYLNYFSKFSLHGILIALKLFLAKFIAYFLCTSLIIGYFGLGDLLVQLLKILLEFTAFIFNVLNLLTWSIIYLLKIVIYTPIKKLVNRRV